MGYSKSYIFHRILSRMEDIMGQGAVQAYFDSVELVDTPDDMLVLRCSPFRRELMVRECLPRMKEVLASLNLPNMDMWVVTSEDYRENMPETGRLPQGSELYRFENFLSDTSIMGQSSNRMAYKAALCAAEYPGKVYNPLVLESESHGVGKTHLMMAIANSVAERFPDYNIVYTTADQFVNELIAAIENDTKAHFEEKYVRADLLLIDDLDILVKREATQQELFRVVSAVLDRGGQVVLTCGCKLENLTSFNDRLYSQLSYGLRVYIPELSMDLRVGFVRQKADELGLALSEDDEDWVIQQSGDARALVGILHYLRLEVDSLIEAEAEQEPEPEPQRISPMELC